MIISAFGVRWVSACLLAALAQSGIDRYSTGTPSAAEGRGRGGFVLMGGGRESDEALRWMMERSAGGNALVIRASGADGLHAPLRAAGASGAVETIVFKDRQASDDATIRESFTRAHSLFIAGGNQWNYVRYWKDAPVRDLIHAMIARGAPVGGSSAGLAVLGQYYFSAEHGSVRSDAALKNPYDSAVCIGRGFLELPELKGIITDSHFAARDRMGRLIAFLARIVADGWEREAKGIGVEEGSAVLVEPGGRAHVVGSGAAYFVRLRGPAENCRAGQPLSVNRVEVERLQPGGVFYIQKWRGGGGEYILTVRDGVIVSTRPRGAIY